ncbi:MAG TPA: CoA ester lyase [Geminicoccaceae bacterium]
MSESAPMRPRRSLLFVPGTRIERTAKAIAAGPDIVCIDLEDAVPPAAKAGARDAVLAWFEEPPAFAGELLVRINAVRGVEGLRDLLAAATSPAPPYGLLLPKVETPDEVALVDDLLSGAGCGARLQVIIETNRGLEACHEIGRASARLDALLFGGIDLAAELRVEPTWEALLYARHRVVHAAAGAGIDLIDAPALDLDDMAGLETETARGARIGMTGKAAIHPKQIPVINRAFTPDAATLAYARRAVEAFARSGTGLVVLDGKLLEAPVLRRMRRILALGGRDQAPS